MNRMACSIALTLSLALLVGCGSPRVATLPSAKAVASTDVPFWTGTPREVSPTALPTTVATASSLERSIVDPAPTTGANSAKGTEDQPTQAVQLITTPHPSQASIEQFALASYERLDTQTDPKGGNLIYIVAQDIVVRAHASDIKRLDVFLSKRAAETAALASGVPDASGNVEVRLHLPEQRVVYTVQGSGVLAEQRLGPGCTTNPQNECIVSTPGFRVMSAEN